MMEQHKEIKVQGNQDENPSKLYLTVKGKWLSLTISEALELISKMSEVMQLEQNRTPD